MYKMLSRTNGAIAVEEFLATSDLELTYEEVEYMKGHYHKLCTDFTIEEYVPMQLEWWSRDDSAPKQMEMVI